MFIMNGLFDDKGVDSRRFTQMENKLPSKILINYHHKSSWNKYTFQEIIFRFVLQNLVGKKSYI